MNKEKVALIETILNDLSIDMINTLYEIVVNNDYDYIENLFKDKKSFKTPGQNGVFAAYQVKGLLHRPFLNLENWTQDDTSTHTGVEVDSTTPWHWLVGNPAEPIERHRAVEPGQATWAYTPHRVKWNLLTLSQGLGGSPSVCASSTGSGIAELWQPRQRRLVSYPPSGVRGKCDGDTMNRYWKGLPLRDR